MGALWLCSLVLCSFGVVLAQNNSGSSCNISLAGQVSVPELCLLAQQAAAQLVSEVVNFTLADNGSIIFEPLPPARVVNVEVNDDSDGLKAWANLANSFVDGVRSGSLPYDIIIPAINSSMNSPIASASCASTQRRTGSGDTEFGDVLKDFGKWWAPILVVTVLGPVFALMFFIVGCCFCCCRLCGKCGGDLTQEHREKNDFKCFILFIMLALCICLLFIGVVFAFVSNDKVNDSIQNFDNTVNDALNSSLSFVDDTQRQANATIDRYGEINTFFQCQIDNSQLTIGALVLDVFGDSVAPLINSSMELAVDLNNSIDALRLVNTTVVKLLNLTQRLQTELDNLTVMLRALQTNCQTTTGGLPVCATVPTQQNNVTVDYTVVDDVSGVLNSLEQIDNIAEQAIEANATFYGIPCDIRNQIQSSTQDILNRANQFEGIIRDIAGDVEQELNDVLDEDGFIGNVRAQSSDIQDTLDQYDSPRYGFSVAICSLTLIVIIVLIVGLLLGAIGFRRHTVPSARTRLSNYGGVILIHFGVPLMFVFAVFLLLLASITFFMGSNMLKICYTIAEDPPNDDIPSYEIFSRIADNSDLWGGYLLGCFLLEDSSIPLTVTSMLNGCRDNQAVYQVSQLERRQSFNLDEITNITNQIPDLSSLFGNLQSDVNFNLDQVLTQETRDSLTSFSNSGLNTINYTMYLSQITSQISTLAIGTTVSTLQTLVSTFRTISQPSLADDTQDIIDEIVRINQTTIAEINNCTQVLEQQIVMLNETAVELSSQVQEVLVNANATFDQLNGPNGTQLVLNRTQTVFDSVVGYATDFANWAVDNLENEIGRCQPLYATYANLYNEVCVNTVDGINGFWLAIGWCVLFFIPTLVLAVWLSQYLRQMNDPETDVSSYDKSEEMLW